MTEQNPERRNDGYRELREKTGMDAACRSTGDSKDSRSAFLCVFLLRQALAEHRAGVRWGPI